MEQFHDDRGIIWPISIAPYQVSLLSIGKDADVQAACDALYADLQAAGIEVLYDDRNERPGVKFNDADLIGNPIRLSISRNTLDAGEIELRLRSAEESSMIPQDGIVEHIRELVDGMLAEYEPKS